MTARNSLTVYVLALLMVWGSGCRTRNKFSNYEKLETRDIFLNEPCPPSHEFPNSGCAVIVAVVESFMQAPRKPYAVYVSAVPVRPEYQDVLHRDWWGWNDTLPAVNYVPLRLTRWELFNAADTMSVMVYANVVIFTDTMEVDGRPPVVAVDSVRHVVRFVDVGSLPNIDTVRLRLRQ